MNDGFTTRDTEGLTLVTAETISARHAFTTRQRGVSGGIFASLNLGEGRGDEPESVRENYRLLGEALGFDYRDLVFTRQVHGRAVRIVNENDRHELFAPVPYEADGIVTNRPGVPLIVFTADCAPVLLHDPVARVIAAVHCGWRGTAADILGEAASVMSSLGACSADIHAAVGPAIGKCCFEVGSEVPEAFRELLGDGVRELIRPGRANKYYADLKGACRSRLEQLGVRPENIAISGECTMCSPEKYWSHRYTHGRRGTQAAVIIL